MASTNRCPQTDHRRGSLARVKPLMTTRVTAPTASRPKATSTGEKDRRPSLIHQNEQPHIAASNTNDRDHGNVLSRTGMSMLGAAGGLVMGSASSRWRLVARLWPGCSIK